MTVGTIGNVIARPKRRLWLLFFRESSSVPFWRRGLRRGFRHVIAAAFYADKGQWIVFDPSSRGTAIEVYSRMNSALCSVLSLQATWRSCGFRQTILAAMRRLADGAWGRSKDCSGFGRPL
jgi:hypothetical protein